MQSKRITDTMVTLSALMGPQHTNPLGNVHGGVIMKMVDEAGGLAATRHARRPVVTIVIDTMTFMKPIRVGMLVQCHAQLTYVGRSSIEVRVEVIAEDTLTGECSITNTAYIVYVALNEDGQPTRVPPLVYETEQQQAEAQAAKARQKHRRIQRRTNED